MTVLTPLLAGEVPSAPILMAVALTVAFLGSVGVGLYVFFHTPERFQSAQDIPEAREQHPPHAA